jgi:hypothetical protein
MQSPPDSTSNRLRHARAPAVKATARAVRAALFASTAMLALAGSGVAVAGSCSTVLDTISPATISPSCSATRKRAA